MEYSASACSSISLRLIRGGPSEKPKTHEVYREDYINHSVQAFVLAINDAVKKIPEQYMGTASVRLWHDYDGAELTIQYETDE